MHRYLTKFICIALCGLSASAWADATIDAAERAKVVDAVARQMAANYVFPDVAAKTGDDLRARLKHGDYDSITSAEAFAKLLSKQVQDISHDGHARLFYSADVFPQDIAPGSAPDPAKADPKALAVRLESMKAEGRKRNFGFRANERLAGNIAYLKIDGFMRPDIGAETAAAEMRKLAGADALIIDLRGNGGGDFEMATLISAYLFDDKPVHLTDQFHRRINETRAFWTVPVARDARLGGDKPVYILTDDDTYSAAEGFAYALQAMKRATTVGEKTSGGAHAARSFYLSDHFFAMIPNILTINPITHTDWEGVGVKPDVAAKADQALLVAQLLAMKPLMEKMTNPELLANAKIEMARLQAQLDHAK